MKKQIPKFKSEDEERKFWAEEDTTEYIDWSQSRKTKFPNLKPSLRSISIRLPESLIERYKTLANKRDVPYQSLMKVFLTEKLEAETKKRA
jgi:predicted DNA binding CopG/RHH family protein